VVFLNLFATWCPPCNSEQPDVVAFAAAHTDDTAVVGVNIAEEDNAVRAYRKKYGITYPIAMDRSNTSARTVFVKDLVIPTTIVLRPDGTLSCAWAAPHDKGWFEAERLAALT
jgi:cytochrome c biogenesis protein CcmG, thiol:disulfide interchange protein DsbE